MTVQELIHQLSAYDANETVKLYYLPHRSGDAEIMEITETSYAADDDGDRFVALVGELA